MNVFGWRLWFSWRLWKWRNWCDLEDFDIHARTMKRENCCFRCFIFFFLSHRKHRTVKGGRGNTKKTDFQVMLISKSYTYPILSSEAIWNLILVQSILQWERQKSFGLWGICSDWGVRNLPVRIAYTVRNMIDLRNSNLKSDHCCATRHLSKNILPPNGHIIEGHLCCIMSGCSLGYK